MKVEFEDLTEEEKAVFEEYRKEKAVDCTGSGAILLT